MTERITMSSRPKQPKYARNKNILVIGGSGSGKTRFFCKPSLLQAHSSYVCTDPKGTLLPEIGGFLERQKYRIKCLNLINFKKSMRYNPLAYARHGVVYKIAKIEEPIARGLGLGTSAHAIGTAKAMELGPVEGAMSSLAIAVAGLLTVVGASVFAGMM